MELNPDPFTGPVIYGLGITCGDVLAAEITLNDIAFGTLEAGATAMDSIPIQDDLDAGENVAELRIGPPGTNLRGPAVILAGDAPATATAKLQLEGDEVTISGDEMTIITHIFARDAWDSASLDGPVALPKVLRVTFQPHARSPLAPWATARAGSPAEVADAVYAETAMLAALLRERNFDAYAGRTSLRRQHKARCYPQGPDAAAMREQKIDDLLRLASAKDFNVRIAAQIGSTLRTQAKSRLFDWVDARGEPIVSIQANGESFAVQHQLSLLDGSLQLVR